MTDRSDLVRAIHQAQDGRVLAQAVAALDAFDKQRTAAAAADRELDLGAQIVAQRMTPAPLHEHHTAATDWLIDASEPAGMDYRTAMIAEASIWYRGLDQAVRGDDAELAEQASGRARTLASRYASHQASATAEFLNTISYLHYVQGASGLPQIDQTVDPNNAPSATPYPAEVFPTFGEEQDPFNGVETNNHGSGAASERAPMLQQLNQQDGGGSGYGSGPEKQLTHDEGFNTQYSYAEVPLGPPGQISTSPAPTDGQAGSAPTPMTGENTDEGSERRQAVAAIEGFSYPDPFGYRWAMLSEVMHPFHEHCGSAHWPDESCGDRAHTASVAIGYSMNLDTARRQAECESVGVREGLRVVASAGTLADLGAHHNRFAAAWNSSGRTADDTAVLHGYMAVVRPVLADLGHEASMTCTACSGGSCKSCSGKGCSCKNCGSRREAAKGLAGGGGVTKSEREHAKHHLPGTEKFPIDSAADVQNAKHDIGRTNEPKAKVKKYINDMAKEYGAAPVGGGKKDHKKAASFGREPNFKQGASGLDQIQQVTDPNNVPAPEDDQLPAGVMFPIDPALGQQWVTGPGGAAPHGQHEAAATLAPDTARLMGRADAMDRRKPQHQEEFAHSKIQHGRYLGGWNEVAGMIHAMSGNAPMSRREYEQSTGRPDLHSHYLAAYAEGRKMHNGTGKSGDQVQAAASLQVQADAWSQPRSTTDDQYPPYNSAATTPPMTQGNGDYQAGMAAGKSDKASGQRPAFADNSSAVSPYVKGYAEGYGGSQAPQPGQDVPYSMGGDSGQAQNSQEAQRAFQVARASRTGGRKIGRSVTPAYSPASPQWSLPPAPSNLSRTSAVFAPDDLFRDPDFRRGYLFAMKWQPGQRLVSTGSAKFEAGMYCAVTDRPEIQGTWTARHRKSAGRHPELGRRIELHRSFTRKTAARRGLRVKAAYLQREAATTTDLITDGPGTSPDPMGATPLNGPGTPPEMAGRSDPAKPGGAPPYQGAPPLSGGPVVSDDAMGRSQEKSQPSGPFTNTFSGNHPENATLAPAAPNTANQPGYSNRDAYRGDPGGDRVARLEAFRRTVQANLAKMQNPAP